MRKAAEPKSCPVCRKASATEHSPFCSRGCKDRDLLRWLDEGYRFAGPAADQAGVDSEEGEG